jgi:LysR family transcriptional regulator, regulator for metE and metH
MQTEMRHLQLIRAIADAGSMTQAGLVLNLTQSALSHQLRDIESRLGTPLFSRAGRRLALTPAGDRLLATAHEVIALVERAEDTIRQEAGTERGVLRLTTECYTCYHWLPSVLKQYRRTHPNVEVRIDVSATDRPMQALLDEQIDLALVSERPRDRRIVSRPLFRDEYAVVMQPDHPLAARPFIRAEDFVGQTLLSYSPWAESTVCQRLLAPAGVAPAHVLQVRLTEAIVEMTRAGLGIGVLSKWAVAPHVAAGTLRAVPLTRGRFSRTWSAATLKRTARLPFVADFIAILLAAQPFDMPVASPSLPNSRPAAASRPVSASRQEVASNRSASPPGTARVPTVRTRRIA